MPRLVLIGMHPPQTMAIPLEMKSECRKWPGGAEPDVAIRPPVNGRSKLFPETFAHHAAEAIRANHEVRIIVGGWIGDVGTNFDAHSQLFGPAAQDFEEG